MIGQTISHYQILDKIGAGGMGVVYKAEDIKLGRLVALKFLPADLTRDPEAKQRFILEARAASSLQHENICTIHDIDETPDGQLFMVMDYYQGETLKETILKGPLPLDRAVDLAVQTAAGLKEAHDHGIVHRDIKPANILITEKGQVKIMDFGLAKLKGQTKLTKTGSTLGTAPYMSPEQARGDEVDARSDIWSFGVVLYEMITGQPAFKGEYEQAVVYSILNETPAPPTGLRTGMPMELERILFKCLEKKASDRYQHLDELIVDLRKTGRPGTNLRIKSRKPTKPALLLLPIILILLIASYFFIGRGGDTDGKSIAVLPFENLSAEGPYAYFAGGLHDELLTQLSKVADMKVISRTSVMGYAGTTKSIKQIARELGVGNIVEGSVQVAGERLRVNVQLIKASTDAHLWAERYDRTLDDAFAIQSDVAQQVVAAVGAVISASEKQGMTTVPTSNAEAYRLYLQGREYFTRPGFLRQNLEVAQELYQRAISIDPTFALAHAELSEVHGLMFWQYYDPSPARATRLVEEAETALRLAPDLPQAHAAMGRAYYFSHRDYPRAMTEYTIALKLMPNDAELWARIAALYRRMGDWKEMQKSIDKAKELNPRFADVFYDIDGASQLLLHHYADAVHSYNEALSLAPDLHIAAVYKGWTYISWQGEMDTLRSVLNHLPMDADLGDFGNTAMQQAKLLFWERSADSLIRFLRLSNTAICSGYSFFIPSSLYLAWAYNLRGDQAAAGQSFAASLRIIDSTLVRLPDDWRVHAARGLALAGLARRDEALREADWLQQSRVFREDALQAPAVLEARTQILVQAGEPGAALGGIEKLLKGPSNLSVHTMQLDPLMDPIRNHPEFKRLMTQYAKQ